MKTYAESKNREPFNWNEFLDKAIANPDNIDPDLHMKARHSSSSWVTCACGNQCEIIERGYLGKPEDEHLSHLCYLFDDQINDKEYVNAKETLKEIEKRSAYLLSKIANKQTDLKL